MKINNNLELDTEKIKLAGKLNDDENAEFRTFLKINGDNRKIDNIVQQLFKTISEQIDCKNCGNCCRSLTPLINENDLKKLSGELNMAPELFRKKYIQKKYGENYFKNLPCSFLEGNICSVYSVRPEVCISYPHLHKKQFVSRLWSVIENYSICPIVYNVLEQLKDRINFR